MKAIVMSKILTGRKPLRSLLAATIALGAATTASAAYWDWKGKSSGTSYFDDTSCWYKSGSTAFKDSNHNISTARGNLNADWDKIITFRNVTELAYKLNLKSSVEPQLRCFFAA